MGEPQSKGSNSCSGIIKEQGKVLYELMTDKLKSYEVAKNDNRTLVCFAEYGTFQNMQIMAT